MMNESNMEVIRGPVTIPEILRHRNNWRRYLAWRGDELDEWTRRVVARTLDCRTPALGCQIYECTDCGIVRLVPHSCKTSFCSSCAAARTDACCRELLSEMLDVAYRHLVFTLPRELRHLIRVNKKVLSPLSTVSALGRYSRSPPATPLPDRG